MPGLNFKWNYEKLTAAIHVLQNTKMVVSRSCFAEDEYEMYKDL